MFFFIYMTVFSMLYWYQDLFELKNGSIEDWAIISNCDFQLSFIVTLLTAMLILVLTYQKREMDPNQLKEEFIYTKFSKHDLEKFESLSDKKTRYTGLMSSLSLKVFTIYFDEFYLDVIDLCFKHKIILCIVLL